jgi:hypothetical protein
MLLNLPTLIFLNLLFQCHWKRGHRYCKPRHCHHDCYYRCVTCHYDDDNGDHHHHYDDSGDHHHHHENDGDRYRGDENGENDNNRYFGG